MDTSGRVTLSVGRGLDLLGVNPDEQIGLSVFELYQDFPHVIQSVHRALAGAEEHILVELGNIFFDSWMKPLRNAAGEIRGVYGVATDVTGRILAERSERTSSDRFLKAFHASPAGILLTELQTGRILDINAALCELTGFDRETLIGQTTLEAGFWPNAEARQRQMNAALKGQGQTFNYHFDLPTGRRLDVTMIVEIVELDDQTCALTILRDNHREQQYRRKLRRARRKYQTLAKFAPVGIFQANAAGELTYINEEFCRLLNGARDELLGNGWWSAVDPEELPELNRIWTQSIEQRTALHCEFQVLLPGVDDEPERIWLQLQLDPAASSGGFVGALTDIDRRKRAEIELQLANRRLEENVRLRTELLIRASKTLEEQIFERRRTYEDLEKSEERWRALMDGAPDVIMLIDRQGSIEYINHTALRPELGVQKVMGRNVLDFVYPEYYDSVKEVVRQVFEEGRSVTNEALGPSDNGSPQWYQSHLAPIYYNNKVIGSTVIVRDITEERRAHAELRQTQERLAHAGRVSTVGELMAGFAHELGQPLFAISSYIEGCLIRLERESESPPDVLQTMREAIDQSHRAIAVVRRLREYLRRQEVQRETYDLNQVVLDAVELASIGVAKNQSRTELRLHEAPLLAQVDRIQIMQVLVNLILNAAEAMNGFGSPDPTVTIETRPSDGTAIEILVTDAGPGLAEGDSERIFDAFVTSKHDGLGLGLSISRSIITAHGGTITASNSSTGIGAVFSILLPGNAGE